MGEEAFIHLGVLKHTNLSFHRNMHFKSHTFTQSNDPTLIIPIGEGGLIMRVGFSEGDTNFSFML